MTKVWCAENECELNHENECMAEEINITAGCIHTRHMGYCRHWECRNFVQSKEAKELFEMLKSILMELKGKSMTRDEVREKGENVPGKIKEGSVVVFNNADKHDKEPCYYPECGTKGIVGSVHDEGEEPILVKWEKGSTSEDDYWYCGEDDVTLSKSSYTDLSQEAKADEGKLMLSLVPTQIIRDVAEVRMYGTKKYKDPDNWKKVELKRYIDAAYRHWLAFT